MDPLPIPEPARSTVALRATALALCLSLGQVATGVRAQDAETDPVIARGAEVYRNQCAECHGERGEGTELDYPYPLEGAKTVDGLARYIDEEMPPGFPEECSAEDAEAVARYIHDAFYSEIARARNAPARMELSRLTVGQYRNAVADLIGSFRGDPAPWGDERGLHGEYFDGRRRRRESKVIDRIDPEIRFDFGTDAPDTGAEEEPEEAPAEGEAGADDENNDEEEDAPRKFNEPNRFAINWEGSLMPPESGTYEIIIRTEHSIQVWVNDDRTPLIDGLVQSGDMTEHRASIPLLAGRPYRVRVSFSKAHQGVEKDDEEEPKIPASVALLWTRPGGVPEVIPSRHLSPGWAPEVFVPTAPFPPDDRSIGYERGTRISAAWEEATTEGAIETAAYVLEHLDELAGTKGDDPDRPAKLRDFASRFVERAFRRPIDDEMRTLYVDRQFDGASDPEAAIKRVLLLTLKSPRFLYLEAGGTFDAFDVASRISFALWDSPPDRELLKAAAEGRLATREQVEEQARRLIDGPRARAKLLEFFHNWLKVDDTPDLAKDSAHFAEFNDAVIADLRTSLDLFLDDVAWGGESADFRRLLLDDQIYLNGRLAAFYGADLPEDAPFAKLADEDLGERAGVLSHPYLLAAFAYTSTSSPIHRGVFLARNVLGQRLRPPPVAVSPLAPDLHKDLSTRERVALQTSPAECMSCHSMINPLGFALERYDAVGRYRLEDNGKPIDATGLYKTRIGEDISFDGVRQLAEFLAESDEVHDAFVQQLFHHAVKQPVRAFGADTLPTLRAGFEASGFDIRRLLVDVVARSALVPRRDEELASAGE